MHAGEYTSLMGSNRPRAVEIEKQARKTGNARRVLSSRADLNRGVPLGVPTQFILAERWRQPFPLLVPLNACPGPAETT